MTIATIDLARARAALAARRARDRAFVGHHGLFGEPAWDLLLQLFIWREEGRVAAEDELTAAAATSPSIAARWLSVLIAEGLIQRPGAIRRTGAVQLTEPAVALICTSLA